jgi:two-component system OmpR family sensor kinase
MSPPRPPRQHSRTAAHSLRRRLLSVILAAIAIASVLQASSAYRTALAQADALFDAQLQALARSVGGGVPLVPSNPGDIQSLDMMVQIWGPDGVQIFRSTGRSLPTQTRLGFSDVDVEGIRYRVYSLQAPRHIIQVAQNLDARRARARSLAIAAMLPVALLAPILMGAVWWLISASLSPLARMRRQVAQRAPDDLSPLPDADLPREVQPLVRELNLLFERMRQSLEVQQQFVADAAHEMRSPLAALKLQAQGLRRGRDGPDHAAAVARLNDGIDRAIQLTEQLLALAREEAAEASSNHEEIDLLEVARSAVGDVLPQAAARGIDVGVATSDPMAIQGRAESMRILLRNLLENAVKYSPPDGRVDISLLTRGEFACISVEDGGPGIPDAERERVFDRFYRLPGAGGLGSGLGLAIVKIIAERHGGTVRLDRSERLGGLTVEVCLPRMR